MTIFVHRIMTWLSSPITIMAWRSSYIASWHDYHRPSHHNMSIIVHRILTWLSSYIASWHDYHYPSHHNMTIIVHRIITRLSSPITIMTWLSLSIALWHNYHRILQHDITIILHRIITWLSSSIASWDSSNRYHHPAIWSSIAAMSIHLMDQMDYK